MRRTRWQLFAASLLVALLGVLGTLQYRWLGEVSQAEGARLRASLRTRASDFSQDFDREITRTYSAFQVESDVFGRDPEGTLADASARAQSSSSIGGIIRAVYVLEAAGPQGNVLQRFDPAARTLTPAEWPPEFARWRSHVAGGAPRPSNLVAPVFLADAIDPKTPALLVPLPTVKRIESGGRFAFMSDPAGPARTIIIWLEADRVKQQLLASLVRKHFGSPESSEYAVSVISRDEPAQTMFASAAEVDLTARNADVVTGLFDLRLDELGTFTAHVPPPRVDPAPEPPGPIVKDRLAITIVRRASGSEGTRVLMAGGEHQGAWQVLVRRKDGSLESLVARSRNRNLAIGLGILSLLAASFVFLIASARRQQRLALQQMEFVAAVSHELRTPLAVIRSAGENLADGVVADGEQVRRYGTLIGSEGRRLSDMVERVMAFAGISSGAPIRPAAGVDLARIVGDAVASLSAEALDNGVTVAVRTNGSLPPVTGDADALRSAIQNIVANAVKYSAAGGEVDVTVDAADDRIRIAVADRGLGVDSADLPHIFKPFYRGRRAVAAQIRGTGVGLSIVRHVIDAHRGDVSVRSRPDGGTIVTVALPAATAAAADDRGRPQHDAESRPARAAT